MTKRRRTGQGIRDEIVYTNPATLPLFGLSTVLTCALFAGLVALGTSVAALRERPWLAVPISLALLLGSTALMFHPLAHRLWQISPALVRSIQTGQLGSRYVRETPNAGFTRIRRIGPLSLVSHVSGRRHAWPRWLRHERQTYQLELDGETLIVRRTGA